MKKILCIGDSNTYGYDPRSYIGGRYPEGVRWTSCLSDSFVINRGLNGMKIPMNYERYLGLIRLENPDLVTVMLGTNDILSGVSAEQTSKRIDAFISHIRDEGKRILLIAPPHLQFGEWVQSEDYLDESCELAGYYREVANNNGCMFADAGEWDIELTFDGVHFSEEGHKIFAQKLNDYISEIELIENDIDEDIHEPCLRFQR